MVVTLPCYLVLLQVLKMLSNSSRNNTDGVGFKLLPIFSCLLQTCLKYTLHFFVSFYMIYVTHQVNTPDVEEVGGDLSSDSVCALYVCTLCVCLTYSHSYVLSLYLSWRLFFSILCLGFVLVAYAVETRRTCLEGSILVGVLLSNENHLSVGTTNIVFNPEI